MTYSPTWTQSDTVGRVAPGTHRVRWIDLQELAAVVTRRRRLTYQDDYFLSTLTHIASGPITTLRTEILDLLDPPTGVIPHTPASPSAMDWLWPIDDGDENAPIVPSSPSPGEVGLLEKLNTLAQWTDPTLSGYPHVRAVHINELRQAGEWLRRGRWVMPVYLGGGILSTMPDTPWLGECIANNGSDEVRSLGFAEIRHGLSPERGLTNVTIRSSSRLEIQADAACDVEAWRCLRELDLDSDAPTWNEYSPATSGSWQSPGGLGTADAERIDTITLAANTPASITGSSLQSALQAMVDGAERNFLFRRDDTGGATIGLTARLILEFDLNTPPN